MFCSMNDAAVAFAALTPRTPDGPAETCSAEALKAGQLAMLQELAEFGMQIARALRDECLARAEAAAADAAAPAPPSWAGRGDLGLIFSRIARAVRQTVAQQTVVFEGIEKARVERQRRQLDVQQLIAQQREEDLRDFVVEAIEAEALRKETPESEVERLVADLDERLDDGDYDEGMADASFPELITRICDDLGVTVDWRLWAHLDWGAEFLKDHTETDIGAERWPDPPDDDTPPDSS